MKKIYTTPEIEITKFQEEEIILMSGLDNDGDVGDWGEEDLG